MAVRILLGLDVQEAETTLVSSIDHTKDLFDLRET
jgi:hypothetical protein